MINVLYVDRINLLRS